MMNNFGGKLGWVVGVLGAAAALATIYQVFFQTSAPVVVNLPDSPAKQGMGSEPARSPEKLSSAVTLIPSFVSNDGKFIMAEVAVTVDGDVVSKLENFKLGVWFLDNGKVASFVAKGAPFMASNNYQTFDVASASRPSNELLLCASFDADDLPIARVELRDISKLKGKGVVSTSNGTHLKKPIVSTVKSFDCSVEGTAVAALTALSSN